MSQIKVLCVDDEPLVLEGLALQLRRGFQVVSARSGAEGLAVLGQQGPFAVVLSDMRMPGMDGATFLARVRELAPDATRMLLTGYADTQSAIAAVNQGQIFRFLSKPCPPEELRSAFHAAAEQNRLVTSERVLLEQTLLGSIKTLTEILAMTSPMVFGKATRVLQHVKALADEVGVTHRWALEVAAMLSQLGYIAVPEEVARKHFAGESLTSEEQSMVGRTSMVSESLLANIPRLEPVRAILAQSSSGTKGIDSGDGLVVEAAVLRIACDFDELESRGVSRQTTLETLRGRRGLYDTPILDAFMVLQGAAEKGQCVLEIPLRGLAEGMVLAEDMRTTQGVLLVARGFQVTAGFLERTRNFAKASVKEPLRVIGTA
jgi:response regulator RpfG family c-di-GMP phosphodiesterase